MVSTSVNKGVYLLIVELRYYKGYAKTQAGVHIEADYLLQKQMYVDNNRNKLHRETRNKQEKKNPVYNKAIKV